MGKSSSRTLTLAGIPPESGSLPVPPARPHSLPSTHRPVPFATHPRGANIGTTPRFAPRSSLTRHHFPNPGRDPPSQSPPPPALTTGQGAAQKVEAARRSAAVPARPSSGPPPPLHLPFSSRSPPAPAPLRPLGGSGALTGGRAGGRPEPSRAALPPCRGRLLTALGGGCSGRRGGRGEGLVPPHAHAALPATGSCWMCPVGAPRLLQSPGPRCELPSWRSLPPQVSAWC